MMSGSFVVAGTGAYRATKVGHDAYASRLTHEASQFTLAHSELRTGINKILAFVTYLMIPAGLLIIYTQLFTTHAGWRQSVLRTVGALVPMVPEGLVLMTSIAFAVGVVRLGRRQCLVQELPAIEGLARVNMVCADKTGTLTENRMQVADVRRLDSATGMDTIVDVLASMAADDARPNASIQAIAEAYRNPPGWTATATAPFKSATKWSGVSYSTTRQLGPRGAGRAAGPIVNGRRAGRAGRIPRAARTAAGVHRSACRPSRRAGRRHPRRPDHARAKGSARRPRRRWTTLLRRRFR